MKHYKARNKTIIKRNPNGRFASWTLGEMVSEYGMQLSEGKRWCRKCHHSWLPLVETGFCPECRCEEKLTMKECLELGYIKLSEIKVSANMINPFTFNSLASGQKFEAKIVDDKSVLVKEFDLKLYVVDGSFSENFFEIPEDKKGVVYLKDRWFYFSKS